SEVQCACCRQVRGYIYTGPVYATAELDESLCPWCLADGTAHEKFAASFVDEGGVGGYDQWDAVPAEVVAEVAHRTPGFTGWQQEQWWTHCGDAAEFLGVAGYAELQEYGEEAVAFIRAAFSEESDLQGQELDDAFQEFDRDHGPTAYVFRCRHCHKLGGYWDCH
ncbi:MAG: CbrC family protein, partial [Abitibacteriaceae bacterium]|nr:CbrC family protein [Abditibacteriaceae bacterium]